MIIYATKKTVERYGLLDDLNPDVKAVPGFAGSEVGNPLQEWGAKLFYFERRKCLQLCNFASRFTIFLFNLGKKDIDLIGELMGFYFYELYCDDDEMTDAIANLYGLKPKICFSALKDKSIIGALNTTQRTFAENDNYLSQFIYDDVIDTLEVNRWFNFEYIITYKIDGKVRDLSPNERFRELVLADYCRAKS